MADTKENKALQTMANIATLNVVSRCKEEVKEMLDTLMAMTKQPASTGSKRCL